jgi:hypothetical protein
MYRYDRRWDVAMRDLLGRIERGALSLARPLASQTVGVAWRGTLADAPSGENLADVPDVLEPHRLPAALCRTETASVPIHSPPLSVAANGARLPG